MLLCVLVIVCYCVYLLLCVIVCTCYCVLLCVLVIVCTCCCVLLCVLVVVCYCVYLLLCVIVCICCCVYLLLCVIVCTCCCALLCVPEQLRVDNSSPVTNWEQLAKGFFIVCLYIYCSWKSSYQEGRVGIPLTGLNLSQARTWISNVICRSLFCVQKIVRFVDIGGIVTV